MGVADRLLQNYVLTHVHSATTNYVYGNLSAGEMPDSVYGVKLDGTNEIQYTYDSLGRLVSRKLSVPNVTNSYTYTTVSGNRTSTQVATMTTPQGTQTYYYDSVGNLQGVSVNGATVEIYYYDNLNQMTISSKNGVFTTYTYDANGNILSKNSNSSTSSSSHTYTYGDATWKDLLTAYDGQTITYDAIGNPLTYRDGMSMTWQNGRELASVTKNGVTSSYTYNAGGGRYTKTVGGVLTQYYVVDGVLYAEQTGSNTLVYLYDDAGTPFALKLNGTKYYYSYNLQGDVIGLLDANGNQVVTYAYDAWGKLFSLTDTTTSGVGTLNPLRYRGYYYDNETGFYYVSSRYYDPETGRFINADAAIGQIGNVQGTNMFAYCFNNPVNMSDPTGNWPKLSTIFTVVAVAAVAVAAVAVTVATCGAAAPALAVAGGGIIGGISAGAAATAASVATGAMIVAGVSTAAAVTSAVAEKAVEKTAKRNNSVYVLKDDAGTVQYVGRTNSVDKRRAAHSANPDRAGLEMEVIASGLNLPESRALEQAGMAYYHTINTANKKNNQINSVSPKYWGAYKELALGTLNYGWNQMSNEILYWTGN